MEVILFITNVALFLGLTYFVRAYYQQKNTTVLSTRLTPLAQPKKPHLFIDDIQNHQLLNEQLQNIVHELKATRAVVYQIRNGLAFLGGKPIFKIALTNEYALQGYKRFIFDKDSHSVSIEPYVDVLYDLLRDIYTIRKIDSSENTPILNRRFHEAGVNYSIIIRIENEYGDIVAILSIGFQNEITYNTFDLQQIISLQERIKSFLLA